MASVNLAYVFGPVLIRKPDGPLSLDMLGQITCFIDFMIINHKQIFCIWWLHFTMHITFYNS